MFYSTSSPFLTTVHWSQTIILFFVTFQCLNHYSVLVVIDKVVHIMLYVVVCHPYHHSGSAKKKKKTMNKY